MFHLSKMPRSWLVSKVSSELGLKHHQWCFAVYVVFRTCCYTRAARGRHMFPQAAHAVSAADAEVCDLPLTKKTWRTQGVSEIRAVVFADCRLL